MSRYDLSRSDLASLLATVDPDLPSYRTDQVWEGLYRGLADPASLTVLPQPLRAALAEHPGLASALTLSTLSETDAGATCKWLWKLPDGVLVETVLMCYPDRATVCVSTQAGCAMGCSFCATGQAGFRRHLTVGEIVEQVIHAARHASASSVSPSSVSRRRVSRVVFMGMGEPLANYDATWGAVHRLHDDLGLSARHLTISTVGVVPGIRRLAGADLPVNLAVSLHAANDAARDRLVPINRQYPLGVLAAACHEYISATRRRLSLEWAMIDGVNDRPADAAELVAFATPLRAHVNLIPLNPTPGYLTRGSRPAVVRAFRDWLNAAGVNATIRQTRGRSIDAACGQLAARRRVPSPATR
jgi:23S rRNA (adenine2503-C2)-methyltransferase